jgi:hypothetical protein
MVPGRAIGDAPDPLSAPPRCVPPRHAPHSPAPTRTGTAPTPPFSAGFGTAARADHIRAARERRRAIVAARS